MRIALAQLNLWVGDLAGNADRIIDAAGHAREQGADLLVCPELALTGYPPDDLLLRSGFAQAVSEQLERLRCAIPDMAIAFGYPEFVDDCIYNSAAVYANGVCLARYRKQHRPNYGVFDEMRYFDGGSQAAVFECGGIPLGLTICEDLWFAGPAAQASTAGARLLINLNASPYDVSKRRQRRDVLRSRVSETGLPVVYVNCVGGQDDIVFDGDSQVVDAAGASVLSSRSFAEGLGLVDLCDDGSLLVPDQPGSSSAARLWPPAAAGLPTFARTLAEPDESAEIYAALTRAIADYVGRNGFPGVYIGLSGGIDSAVTLALAADALGPERVHAVAMPSRYSADISTEDARLQAELLGVKFSTIPIEPGFIAMQQMLAEEFAGQAADISEENLQSRLRGNLLMALSNKFGGLVLATGNKSEMAVGYATLYGDMCGGFAPIKDVYKTQVYGLARYRNAVSAAIPERVISRAPSAELRPDQKDEDSLPPYERLDPILTAYIESQLSITDIVARGFDEAEVRHIVGLVRRAEYKRRQAAPGPKISSCAFGRERRLPITATYGDW